MTVASGTTLQLPRSFAGKHPRKRHSKREKRVIETADSTARLKTNLTFANQPILGGIAGAALATTDAITQLMVADGEMFEYLNIGAQTILGPAWTSAGLNISRDLTENEGTELTMGITARAKHAYTVGTTKPFYFQVTMTIADVSAHDHLLVGWRKAEAYQADWEGYDELAAFNIVSGDIKTSYILNNATTVTVDSTDNWADTASKTIRVEVDQAGRVTYWIDGVRPTIISATPFDAGEVVVPFIHIVHDSAGNGLGAGDAVTLTALECGLIGV